MVSMAVISSATQNPDPDLDTIIKYLEEQGDPVAVEKAPLKVIAPAVSQLHARARTLEFELTAKDIDLRRLKNAAGRGFGEIMEMYAILAAIAPPVDYAQSLEFEKEKEFARKLMEIGYRIYKAVGGKPEMKWEGVMPSVADRERYSAELKVLRANYPDPEFASMEHMVKQGARAAFVGWIFILIFIGFQTGIIPALIAYLLHKLGKS